VHDTSVVLVLSGRDVERLLDPDALIDAVAEAMAELSEGRASMPARIAADVEERDAFLAAMPAYLPSVGALETKLVAIFPGNTDRPTHQAVICAFDPEDGTPVGLLDGTTITEARTAACSALATRLLAREDAETLAILGTGVQARSHARFVTRVRPFRRLVVAGRSPEKARVLAGELEVDPRVEVAPSFEDAVGEADVVCATTHSPEPVVRRGWLRPGTHVNSVGYNTSGQGEVDTDTVADAAVFVESRAAALAPPPSGAVELLTAIEAGRIDRDHIRGEIGELVTGTGRGRSSPDEITLYKSVGVAAQDAAAAALVLEVARREGAGIEIEL
jgi:ornithine cyclodeaminase/alanine dehydrogenase-like protein (mu-crystallin family)